jgi:D-alanine-D-alanine ligase
MSKLSSLKIGVLMGGESSEREISLRSGNAVHEALAGKGYSAVKIDLRLEDAVSRLKESAIDFAFIALHGRGGEDGLMQSILEGLEIPYLGSDSAGSKRAFDKFAAKDIFSKAGIPTPPWLRVSETDWQSAARVLGYPLFVKPQCEGSSIGVKCLRDDHEFRSEALPLLREYRTLLAEKKITGREITVGIIGEEALPVVEIRTTRSFYDYEAKYTEGYTDYFVPAEIGPEWTGRVQEIALQAFRVLGLRDFSRVDLILAPDGPYVLEVNTIPGFTEKSLLPKAARAKGLEFAELCERLLEISRNRWEHEKKAKTEKICAG